MVKSMFGMGGRPMVESESEFYAIVDKQNRIIDVYNPEFSSKHPAIFRSKFTAKFHINRIKDTENVMGNLRVVKLEVRHEEC